ncbi:hypothetical protein [Hyphococcus sp.]|uniref:hypothetical protein n=1 Tax=Hyphococcus sp. TaxID=2038636 RepID=UPI0035C71321
MKKFIFLLLTISVSGGAVAQPTEPRAPMSGMINVDRAVITNGEETLSTLLKKGYNIIHVDAPAGQLKARFILRRDAKLYSCEQTIWRSGNSPDGARAISTPCLDLTP